MALDFKNAFNTVEHAFVYDVLGQFNFGEDFISWVKLLHNGTELAVINNGFTSPWFRPSRGLQQGCPVSAPIFALVAEILAIKLRGTAEVHGIDVAGTTFKVSQYCDDLTVFVRDGHAADRALELVKEFGNCSGLELNLDKCNFMWLGSKKCCNDAICGRAPVQVVQILGVWFSATQNCNSKNFQDREAKIKTTLDQWSQRDLTIKWKVTVAKSLLVSQLVYIMNASKIERKSLAVIQSLIMNFLWRGRPPKVARRTLSMTVERGGLNAPDLLIMDKASRIAWIGRLMRLSDATFVQVLQKRIRTPLCKLVQINYDEKWILNRQIPEFYKDMLTWFKEVYQTTAPLTGCAIRQQCIWHNKAIHVQGKTLGARSQIEFAVNLIDDFVDGEGSILTYDAFLERHAGTRVNPLTYMGWCRAIPTRWRNTLTGSAPLTPEERSQQPTIKIKDKEILLAVVKSSFFYQSLMPEITPTAQRRWATEGINLDWNKVYERPFKITMSTKLQSLQYRITHRYFPTRRFLCIRQVTDDPFCDSCGIVETLEHYFFYCAEVLEFWQDLVDKLNQKPIVTGLINFTCYEVMFGSSKYPAVVNLIMLLGKQFIVNQHYSDSIINLQAFRPVLLKHFNMEKAIAHDQSKVDRLRDRWRAFIADDSAFEL